MNRLLSRIITMFLCMVMVVTSMGSTIHAEEIGDESQETNIVIGSAGDGTYTRWEFNPDNETLTFYGYKISQYRELFHMVFK